jgi:hypothetical protein
MFMCFKRPVGQTVVLLCVTGLDRVSSPIVVLSMDNGCGDVACQYVVQRWVETGHLADFNFVERVQRSESIQ